MTPIELGAVAYGGIAALVLGAMTLEETQKRYPDPFEPMLLAAFWPFAVIGFAVVGYVEWSGVIDT